ncbi:MAG TPA: helix-turn-helix domain-containing protein, partial [Burkholderiaceae bacterium]|nr:helix-turn-helix domain-containing protein [Burkholderiaceae bacterium]
MTDDDVRAEPAPAAGDEPASFGARLAAAREKEGLSVGDMAARLRLHVNQVRALESENLARLPEAAYVRGFVRSYARSLALDPAPLIDDLNSKLAPAADSVVDGMTRARDYSPVRAAAQERTSRSLVLGLSVVALVALGALGWYATRQPRQEPAPPVAPSSAAPAQPVAQRPSAEAQGTERPSAGGDGQPATATEPAPAPSQPLVEAGSVLLVSFSGSSWVEVTDASGKVVV